MPEYVLVGCPACGHPESLELADAEQVRRELEALWQFHLARVEPGAPLRELYDRAYFSQRPPIRVVECAQCGTLRRDPAEADRSLEEAYAAEDIDPELLDDLFRAQREFYRGPVERLTEAAGKCGRGIELGSYVGAFLAAADAQQWQFSGLDVNAETAARAAAHGVRVRVGTLEEVHEDGAYDAVALVNCFDQLPNPRAVLAEAARLLAPGGVVALRVPNGAFYARFHRNGKKLGRLGTYLLAHNNLLSFPYRFGYTPASLEALLADCGFAVVRRHGDALVNTSGAEARTWARVEERLLKRALRVIPADDLSPWFELYARVQI